MFSEFMKAAGGIYDSAKKEKRLIENPTDRELRKLSIMHGAAETERGSIAAESEPVSRAAMFTKNNIDAKFGSGERRLLGSAKECLSWENLVSVDVLVGSKGSGVTARIIVPERFAHVAYGGAKIFAPAKAANPTYWIVMFFDRKYESNKTLPLPKKSIDIRIAFSKKGGMVKLIRNSNYVGEWKKGIFAAEDWRAKQKKNAIFLHTGCRKDRLKIRKRFASRTSLFIALSANGKTSTTTRSIARYAGEQSFLVQDDGGTLRRDGSFRGFEAGGLFVKTDRLSRNDQPETYDAVMKKNSFLLNVAVDSGVDFFDTKRTTNGRAVVGRKDCALSRFCGINAGRVDNMFLISRGKTIPALAKLTREQAAAFMVLGESMETSAGDPTQAGKIKNEFFYDPFIAGDRAAHANLFYRLVKGMNLNFYLLNTGGVGDGNSYRNIRLQDTMTLIEMVLREKIDWEKSGPAGLMVPSSVDPVDSAIVHPENLYDPGEFRKYQKKLMNHRRKILSGYQKLDRNIKNALKN